MIHLLNVTGGPAEHLAAIPAGMAAPALTVIKAPLANAAVKQTKEK